MKNIEIGPIRPPSESNSLLVRVTRGCHWNKCYFCGLYKSMRFSMRPIEEIIEDINELLKFGSSNLSQLKEKVELLQNFENKLDINAKLTLLKAKNKIIDSEAEV